MKLFRNMSNRDRGLLMLLVVVVVFYVCYAFMITPALEKAASLKGEIEMAQSDLERANALMGQQQQLRAQADDMLKQLNTKYSVFFADLNQSRILYKLDTLMQGSGIAVSGYTPAPEAVLQVPVELGTYAPIEYPLLDLSRKIKPDLYPIAPPAAPVAAVPEGATEDMIPGTDITLTVTNSTYESVYSFIGAVENMNKTVVLKNVSLAKGETGLTGQVVLGFYSLPSLDEKRLDELKFKPIIPKGKANPFQ